MRRRIIYGAVSIAILAYPVVTFCLAAPTGELENLVGVDYEQYMSVTRRWLDGGPFYEPHQLAGPYVVAAGDVLYPPVSLILFVPFTALPPPLWWVIPIVVVMVTVTRLRPDARLWPLLALCLAWPPTAVKLATGNPVLWIVAASAAGVVLAWPYVFVLLKPTLALIALLGIRHRSWWIALAGLGIAAVTFGSMWSEWFVVISNAQGAGLLYSIQEVPMVLLPVIAAVPIDTIVDRLRSRA